MAQQDGIIKLRGKVGDLSFYKTKDGYQARKKGGVSANRIKNDPRYQRTRENMVEFTEVCKTSKKIRDVLRSMILFAHDAKMTTRLTARVYRMMKADTINLRGERKVKPKNLVLLNGFNFNEMALINNVLFVTPFPIVNRVNGLIELHIPEILPDVHLVSPKGTTHFQITVGAAIIDLIEREKSCLELSSSNYLQTAALNPNLVLSCTLPSNLIDPIVVLIGISFYKELNGVYYLINNGVYSSLCVLTVDTI